MGAGASNTQKTGNQNVDKTIQKLAVVGALRASVDASKIVKPSRTNQKEDIYDFVRNQKESREDARVALEKELEGGGKSLSILPQEQDTSDKDKQDLYNVPIQEEDTIVMNYCGVCNKPTRVTIDGWPCRVCGQTYHRKCIANSNRYNSNDVKMFDRANTPVGWSCEHCDNILNLLSPEEVDKLASAFEDFDKNKDSSVSLDEFMAFKKHCWEKDEGQPMPSHEERFQMIQFKMLDADGSGQVDYWEFVKNEACKNLARRSKEDLVRLLTPLEKQSAKNVYDMLDVDKDGVITEDEARVAFRSWYNFVDKSSKQPNRALPKGATSEMLKPDSTGTDTADHHATQHTNIVLDADEDGDRMVTWQEFLRSQALYILSSRPNKVNLKR